MKIVFMTVGPTEGGWISDALRQYSARIPHYVPFEIKELPAVRKTSSMQPQVIKDLEAGSILGGTGPQDSLWLLDEKGTEMTSEGFASFLSKRMNSGARNLIFVCGGAFGFAEKVYRRADGMISLSRMTFTHQMVRPFFAEQLYRALTILKGEHYHNP